MAETVISTLGSWEAERVTVSQVESALSDLRRHEQRAAVRTSVLTLVVVVDEREEADQALEVVRRMGGRHPSRTIVVVASEDEGSGMDASLVVHVAESEGRTVCFEDLVLDVRGPARHHLDSVVEPFTLPDLPVAVWLPSRLPSLGDPLLDTADRIVIDTRAVPTADDVLPRVSSLARRLPVTDLSWVRLAPWRSLLAGLFEGSVNRPFVDGVRDAEIDGHAGPRVLLGGWLLQRLRLSRAHVHLREAEHVSIRLTATADGKDGHFCVSRPDDTREIRAEVAIEGRPPMTQTLRMRDRWPARALADALTQMGRDVVYEAAVAGALELQR